MQGRLLPVPLVLSVGLLFSAGCRHTSGWQHEPDPGEPRRSGYLQAYVEAHYQDLGTHFRARLSMEQFLQKLGNVRVLFLGDHHRDGRLHAKFVELLHQVIEAGHRPVLGLEAVGFGDNHDLQQYLEYEIELEELCRRTTTRWPGSWLGGDADVDGGYFRELLRLARQHRVPVFPLEPTPRLPLGRRDRVIARSIRDAARAHPRNLIVVIVGHAHLLGKGRLVARVGLPNLAVGARMSRRLTRAYLDYPRAGKPCFLEATSGVLFFHPMTPKGLARIGAGD